VENVDEPCKTPIGTSLGHNLFSVIRVSGSPEVSVGPRALLAPRVPSLAVEQWKLHHNRPPEKSRRPAHHGQIRIVALHSESPRQLCGHGKHPKQSDTRRDLYHLHGVLGRVPVQIKIGPKSR
jgi:hypothetical protein